MAQGKNPTATQTTKAASERKQIFLVNKTEFSVAVATVHIRLLFYFFFVFCVFFLINIPRKVQNLDEWRESEKSATVNALKSSVKSLQKEFAGGANELEQKRLFWLLLDSQ